jgi:hypothetical protein
MTKLTKKLLSVFSASAIALNAVVPVLATDSVSISGNGYGSDNEIEIESNSETVVKQMNTAVVTNSVSTTSSTGGNKANYNTGGDSFVYTGDADSRVTVTNTLNSNEASVACCGSEGLDISIDGNGAESDNEVELEEEDSKPYVRVNNNADITVLQDNLARVVNAVEADAKTGYNDTNYNTGGESVIMTGDADSRVGVTTTANSNWAKIGGSMDVSGAGMSAYISGNGYNSDNEIEVDLEKSTGVFQKNLADVVNDIEADAKSGGNDANYNTGGAVGIMTGYATSIAGVENQLNFNWADVNCCALFDLEAYIGKNGAYSDNEIDFDLHSDRSISQTNKADVVNSVAAESGTGKNEADKNTGGDVEIMTGNAESLVGIANELNFNYANLDCCMMGLSADIMKNGAESDSEIEIDRHNNRMTWQENLAGLVNEVGEGGAFTGKNDADYNTGDPNGDPGVWTGNALAMTTLSNSLNVNSDDVMSMEIPGFDWEFQFSWNWNSFLSVFGW